MNKDPNVVLIGKWAIAADAVELNRIVQTATIPSDEFRPSHWPKHDTWTLDEAILLLSGLDPDGTIVGKSDHWVTFPNGEFVDELVALSTLDGRRFEPAFILEIENRLRAENKTTADPGSISDFKHWLWGTLERIQEMRKVFASGGHPDRTPPLHYIEQAEAKGYGSKWCDAWRKSVERDQPRNTNQLTPADTTGMVAWQATVLELWPEISKSHDKAPTTHQVVTWLKRNGPRGVFPEQGPDRYSLTWIDREGNTQTVTSKSVGSRISEWRKAGKIPAK